MIVLTIAVVCQAGVSVVSLISLRQTMMRDRIAEVKHLTEAAYSTVTFYHDQAVKGLMSDDAAQEAARNALRVMRYDNGNYFCAWTLDGTGVVHGSHPEWEGKTFLNSALATQFPVVANMVSKVVEAAKSDGSEGLASYRIPKPGQTKPVDKIAYVHLFEPWGWSVNTGAYVDDIDVTFRKQAFVLLRQFVALIVVYGLIAFALANNLARALTRLAKRVAGVAAGEFDAEVPDVERGDEVGVMARALLVLRDNSREAMELRLDQLTGLPNRKVLMERLRVFTAAAARKGCFGAVMLIDLDKFKALNDSRGHHVGDLLLIEVARRLIASVRERDIVARLGGDEFVVGLLDIGQKEEEAVRAAETIGEKILASLNQPYQLDQIGHAMTASVGITLFQGDSTSVDDLLKQADLAMYRSKQSGRDTCRFFDPRMEATLHERIELEASLRQAIEEKHFQLYYQPQIDAANRIVGVEALLRWNHPQRGLVLPGSFISMAEESGLILPLGQWVLESGCHQLALWAARPETAHLKLSINVSARQFERADFVERVLAIVEKSGADPHRLEFELTESILVNDAEEIIGKIQSLKRIGIKFCLDDFGTGYSSLTYLKNLPIDALKIDQSFVRDLPTNPNDFAIAKTIIALAASLRLGIVAEGVETVEQRDFLASADCGTCQGYLFCRPMSVDRFEQFVLRGESAMSEAHAVV
jgi:diguanylate cyclase (GGDEF)-like protein